MRSVGLAICSTVLAVTPLGLRAQAVTRISNENITNVLLQTDRNDSRGVAFRMSEDLGAQFILNRRTVPSEIELHCAWDDLMLVRSGMGELQHSNKLKGLSRFSAWEWRATALAKSKTVPLTAGDVVRIPAGEAHTIRPVGDAPLVYVIVKVRSTEATPCGSLPMQGR